jgi:signal transduction histidine kinase
MFQLAQIDAGGLKLNYESVSISDLISDCLEGFTEIARREDIELRGIVHPGIGEVIIDASRINRVLTNLIDNSLRHTRENGLVEVVANQTPDAVLVSIEDNGDGISSKDLPHIFDKFYRGDSSRRGLNRRAGLGLAIAKGIINAHGGEISVTSQPGKTRFTFSIPKNKLGN